MVTEELMRAVAQERIQEAAAIEREAKLQAFLRESESATARERPRRQRPRVSLPSFGGLRRVAAVFGRA